MAVFEYKAVDLDSSAVGGTITADSPRRARDVLRERGLTVTQIEPADESQQDSFLARRRGRTGRSR